MRFKLLVAFVEDTKTSAVMQAAREAGSTGCTVVTAARGEGLKPARTFFGLNLETQRDVLFFLVEEHQSRSILETICRAGEFDTRPGTGIAIQLDVEDAVGLSHQVATLNQRLEEIP